MPSDIKKELIKINFTYKGEQTIWHLVKEVKLVTIYMIIQL